MFHLHKCLKWSQNPTAGLTSKCHKKKCICDVLCLWEQNYLSLLSSFYKSISCSSLEMMDAAKSKIKWSWRSLSFCSKIFWQTRWPERFFVWKIIAIVLYQVYPNYCEATTHKIDENFHQGWVQIFKYNIYSFSL